MAVRGVTPWEAASLSAIMIAAIPELTCYYYSFLIVMAFLWEKRKEAGMALLLVTAGTGFADMAPTQYLPSQGAFWSRLNHMMPTWLAEQYTLMSAITLAGLIYILYQYAYVPQLTPAVAGGGDAPVAPPVDEEKPAGAKKSGGGRSGGGSSRKRKK
jgi:hypothetical protein